MKLKKKKKKNTGNNKTVNFFYTFMLTMSSESGRDVKKVCKKAQMSDINKKCRCLCQPFREDRKGLRG